MLNFVHLPSFLCLYVLDLSPSWEVVSEPHTDPVSDYRSDAEGQNSFRLLSRSDTCEYNDESINGAIESPVDEGFEDVSGIDVVFLMYLACFLVLNKGFVDIALGLLHW